MIGPRIRRAAAVAALAGAFALAAPTHAAGWRGLASNPSWLDDALEWIARLWTGGGEPERRASATEKNTTGTNPDGSPQAVTPPASEKYGMGTDPNGTPGTVTPPATTDGDNSLSTGPNG